MWRPLTLTLPGAGDKVVDRFEVGARSGSLGVVQSIHPSMIGVTVVTDKYVVGVTLVGSTVERVVK